MKENAFQCIPPSVDYRATNIYELCFSPKNKQSSHVAPPKNLDLRYFDHSGNPKSLLLEIKERVLSEFYARALKNEIFEGIYVVGSSAVGNHHADSDLDLYLKARIGYNKGKSIANSISYSINPSLSDSRQLMMAARINPDCPNIEDLIARGLCDANKEPSTITILHRLGLVSKNKMVDIIVGAVTPWGRVYDFDKSGWFKYVEGDRNGPAGTLSPLFTYGF